MSRRKIVAVAVILAAVAAGVILYLVSRQDGTRGDLKLSGNIEITSTTLSFKVPGRVASRMIDEGDAVSRGELVATLEDVDFLQEVAIRKGERETAAAALRELLAGSRKEEILQAEAALAAAEAEALRAEDDFRRQHELYEREVIPKQKYEAALTVRDMTRAQVRQAKENLALVRKGPRIERIQQGQGRLVQAEAALALAEERLRQAQLRSPVAGVVTAKHAEPGEQVNAGTPIVTVGDLEHVWMRGYIPETELGRVRLNQEARVTTDTWPGKSYRGTVSFISPEAEFTPKNVQTDQERVKLVYRVKVSLDNPNHELKPGMPADAVILGTAAK